MIITSSRVCQVYALCKVPATPYSNASRTHTDGHVHTLRHRQTCSGTTPRHTHVAIKLQMPSAHCPCCCFVAAVEERVENISLKCVPPLECSSPLSYSTCAQPVSHFTYSTSYLHFPHTSSSVSCSLSLSASRARL